MELAQSLLFGSLFIMLLAWLIMLAVAVVKGVSFSDDSYDQNVNDELIDSLNPSNIILEGNDEVEFTDLSSVPFKEATEIEGGLGEYAQVCSSSLDNNEIVKRQTCKPKGTAHDVRAETPAKHVTLHPQLPKNSRVKLTSDPECVNFPSRTEYVTCGGPEIYTPTIENDLDSHLVYNCFKGTSFRCLSEWQLMIS